MLSQQSCLSLLWRVRILGQSASLGSCESSSELWCRPNKRTLVLGLGVLPVGKQTYYPANNMLDSSLLILGTNLVLLHCFFLLWTSRLKDFHFRFPSAAQCESETNQMKVWDYFGISCPIESPGTTLVWKRPCLLAGWAKKVDQLLTLSPHKQEGLGFRFQTRNLKYCCDLSVACSTSVFVGSHWVLRSLPQSKCLIS